MPTSQVLAETYATTQLVGSALNGALAPAVISPANVFSSTDIVAYLNFPNGVSRRFASLSLLSISTHRDKFPVTAMGSIRSRGFTNGHLVVGGTLVFNSLDRTVWWDALSTYNGNANKSNLNINYSGNFLPDDLPLFDITVTFVNELGRASYTGVSGVTILDEGESYSVNNIEIMESYSYMAIDRIPLQPYISGGAMGPSVQDTINSGNTPNLSKTPGVVTAQQPPVEVTVTPVDTSPVEVTVRPVNP